MSEFSDRLKTVRLKQGFTQKELASSLNITRAAYSAWESGRNEPSFALLASICKTLGVTADYLIGLSDSSSGSSDFTDSIKRITEALNCSISDSFLAGLTEEQVFAVTSVIRAYRDFNADSRKKEEA